MDRGRPNSPVTLCLGVHDHQPVGNFDHVISSAVERCYRPFFETVARHPRMRWAVHVSGPLLLWLSRRERGLVADIGALARSGQVEILGSGLGEPVLSILPPADVEAQIRSMRDLVGDTLGATFRGIWLTERAWDPSLPALLAPLGVEYTLVDDHHFFRAGFSGPRLSGRFVVARHGRAISVLPISEELRYLVPFAEPARILREVGRWAQAARDVVRPPVFTCVDDGEKFGLWPGTHEWVYGRKWLERFLEALEEREPEVRTALPAEIVDFEPPSGQAVLPTASYREMMEWALPADPGPRRGESAGGFFDQFLVKYGEAGRLHGRMLLSSRKVAAAETARGGKPARRAARARLALSLGQCNDAYWHGLFGGIYLPFLRAAACARLIEADVLATPAGEEIGLDRIDLDADGTIEIVARTPDQTIAIKPSDSGCVYLWDDHALLHSFSDTLSRRREAYHGEVARAAAEAAHGRAPRSIHDRVRVKEPGLERLLVYDRRMRLGARAYVLAGPPRAGSLRRGRLAELGGLGDARFDVRSARTSSGAHAVTLVARGADLGFARADVIKRYRVPLAGVGYGVSLSAAPAIPAHLAPRGARLCLETNIALNALDSMRWVEIGGRREAVDAEATARDIREIAIRDAYRGFDIVVRANLACDVALYPVETVSNSEDGFERIVQGICLVLGVPVVEWLAAGLSIRLEKRPHSGRASRG